MKKRILVVDDEDKELKRIAEILEKEGYSVVEASNEEDAILKAREMSPDLVIIDVVTKDSNVTGFDLCHKIKAALHPKPLRVLMITGKVEGINVSLANQAGADGFEAKTSSMADVTDAARSILSKIKN